jgi:CRP-like cAMP-binding protein
MAEDKTRGDKVRALKDRSFELLAKGKRDAAIGDLKRVLELTPGDTAIRQKLADVLVRLDRKREAVEQYAALVGRFVANKDALKAIAIANVILQLDPMHTETQRTLAGLIARREGGLDLRTLPSAMRAALSVPPPPKDGEPAPPEGIEALARIPLFSDLDAASFVELIPRLERRAVLTGGQIVREGEPGDAMFAVVTGVVRVQRRVGDELLPIAEMGEGTFFGEMALVADVPRFADVVAATDTELLVIRRRALEELLILRPSVRDVVLRFHKARLHTNLLRASPMFLSLPADERASLVNALELLSFDAGAKLVRQGEPVPGLHVILRGRCAVEHETSDGPRPMPTMIEGDVFGEIALLGGTLATATVRAEAPTVVLRIGREVALGLLKHKPFLIALAALGEQRLVRTRALLGGVV